jgi:FkbM family methyltransferase
MRGSIRERPLISMLLKKVIGLLQLVKRCHLGVLADGPSFGYCKAVQWHFRLFWDHIRSYANLAPRGKPISVRVSGSPVWLRPWTSDYAAYHQVFRQQEYAGVDETADVRSIIDCGANIGLASIYFLNRFPKATVLAVEPDPENVALCSQNLKPYGARAKVIHGAVWSHRERLAVIPSEFGLGEKWGMQVRPFRSGDPDNSAVDAFDIPFLLAHANLDEVDILKIDIERSELIVFSFTADSWLPRVRNLAIELHDEECSRAFFSALENYDYRLVHRGDLTYCLGLTRLPPGLGRRKNAAA